jgi:hypothetical protein
MHNLKTLSVLILTLTLLCAQSQAAPRKSPATAQREARIEKALRDNLRKNKPQEYFAKYVAGNYYLFNGQVREVTAITVRAMHSTPGGQVMFTQERTTQHEYAPGRTHTDRRWEPVSIEGPDINGDKIKPGQVCTFQVQYLGEDSRRKVMIDGTAIGVPKYRTPPQTIDYATYAALVAKGMSFPCDDPLLDLQKAKN